METKYFICELCKSRNLTHVCKLEVVDCSVKFQPLQCAQDRGEDWAVWWPVTKEKFDFVKGT